MAFQYLAFYKPFGVLSQFTGGPGDRTLSEFNFPKGVYAAGRLDKDSEGLLILTDDGPAIKKLTDPKSKKEKTYWVQVDGDLEAKELRALEVGVIIQGKKTLPCKVKILEMVPDFPERSPPIRVRKSIPTTWIEVKLTEGRNRQVRRMTAFIGFPTLRLVRVSIGNITLKGLEPGQWRAFTL